MSRLLMQNHLINIIPVHFNPPPKKKIETLSWLASCDLIFNLFGQTYTIHFLSNRQGQQACFYGNPHFFYLSVSPEQLVGILEDPLISPAKKQFCLLIKRLSWLSNFTCRLCEECEHAFILPFIMADPVMGGWGLRSRGSG